MKSNANHADILVLSQSELDLVGGRIVGGATFADAMYISAAAVSILGSVMGFCYWLAKPSNRKEAWQILMSNFDRSTVSAVAQAAASASTTPASARDDLSQVAAELGSSRSDSTVYLSALNIIDDPNEL